MSESSQPPTESPLRTAWHWSVEKSPILNTWRTIHHKLHPQQRATERLIASNLPEPISDRISEIIRRTRLRSIERDEVCRELIAHAADALRESESPKSTDPVTLSAQIAQSLGDPKVAAQLIRRAMKRKRSVYYQARVLLTRTTLAGIAALILVYAGLFIRFHSGSPTIKTDYLAKLNATTLATPESDRAIGVYQEVLADWKPTLAELRELQKVDYIDSDGRIDDVHLIDHIPNIIKPDHPHFQAVREAFIAYRPQFDRLHEASQRPIMGYLLTHETQSGNVSVDPTPGLAADSLVQVILPHLGQLRHIARLLAADTRLAAADADAQRVTDNLAAIANTARLLSDAPFVISNLVAIAIQNFAVRELNTILAQQPDLLSADQLLTLSHTLAASRDKNLTLNLQGESYFFEDLIQRVFTDNGHGDGRLTPDGLKALMAMTATLNPDFTPIPPSTLSKLAGPLSMEFVASRAEVSKIYHAQIRAAQEALARGPESLPELHAKIDELEKRGPIQEARILPISAILPAFYNSIRSVFKGRAQVDASLIALAAESFRREHDDYPQSLEQLVPNYLPALPQDPFDPGQPMKYRLTDTGFMVYVAGADGDDDGGTPHIRGDSRAMGSDPRNVQDFTRRFPCQSIEHQTYDEPFNGDWILFPPQD